MRDSTTQRIELFAVHVPLPEVVRQAMARSAGGLGMAIAAEEAWTGGDFVIARLTADDGAQGIGEAFVWLPETGVSPAPATSITSTCRTAACCPASSTRTCIRSRSSIST